MNKIVNEQRDTTALVERYIGSAYDTVRLVAGNLGDILSFYTDLQHFQDTWLGNLDYVPSTRNDGTALQDGDRYYNTNARTSDIYVSSAGWVNQNQATIYKEVFEVKDSNRVGNDIVISLQNAYTPGTSALLVDIQGVAQISLSDSPLGAYEESSTNTITFPNAGVLIENGEKISVTVINVLDFVNPVIAVKTGTYITETVDQYEIPLPNGITYTPNKNNITIHINGSYLISGIDYVENSPTTIYMSTPAQPGDKIAFSVGTFTSNAIASYTDFYSLVSVNAFYENRDYLNTTQIVITQGGNTKGDGSGGTFVFDPTADRSLANGVTMVDATVPAYSQGTISGNGCWVRQYEGSIHPAWFNSPYRGMAAIRSLKGLSGDTVVIQGFYENESVGGGVFTWDGSMSAALHNGGTIISPSVIASPGTPAWYVAPLSGTGCWVRQETSPLSVSWFGGTPSAVDSSLAFIGALSVGTPEVPEGTYTINSIIIGSFYSFGAVSVIGTGNVTAIKNLLV